MKKINRRDFLKLAADSLLSVSALLGLGGLFRFLSFEMDPAPPAEYDLGSPYNYPLGARVMLNHVPAVLIHDEQGFRAYSLICTHLGCTVEQAEKGFECPCHGSRYDNRGLVTRGPSKAPLRPLRVELNEQGNLILYNASSE